MGTLYGIVEVVDHLSDTLHKSIASIEMAKASRRAASRKSSRKMKKQGRRASRRASRRANRRANRMYGGGVLVMSPADVNDKSMFGPSNQSAAQGLDYTRIHQGQHGGAYVSLNSAAPVGYTGMLDDSLRATARIAPLDASVAAIQGMSDQAGGARRSKRNAFFKAFMPKAVRITYRKGSKMVRKGLGKVARKMRNTYRKGSKMVRRTFRMRGGGGYQYANQGDYASPGMLLPSSMEAKALMQMNPEWKLAADPASFAPRM